MISKWDLQKLNNLKKSINEKFIVNNVVALNSMKKD